MLVDLCAGLLDLAHSGRVLALQRLDEALGGAQPQCGRLGRAPGAHRRLGLARGVLASQGVDRIGPCSSGVLHGALQQQLELGAMRDRACHRVAQGKIEPARLRQRSLEFQLVLVALLRHAQGLPSNASLETVARTHPTASDRTRQA